MAKRPVEEAKEGLKTISNDAPEGRFQNEQQVAPSTPINGGVDAGSFVPEKKSGRGSVLRSEVAAKTVKDATLGGSNAGDGVSFSGRSVSGSNGGVLGAANATPVAGKARSDTRYGKKLDRHSTKINFIPCDQILVEYDESKPLADASDADQGFNGTYRNEFGRSQKKMGNVPAELMFDRSVDLIAKDQLYFGQGQVVLQTGVLRNDSVRRSAVKNALGQWVSPAADNYYAADAGNFLTKELHFALDDLGAIRYFYFVEDELNQSVSAEVANKSSVAALTLTNDAELVRESMDAKAGDEKADIWTPLARADDEPTQTIALLRDLEAETGNELLTGYRKACTSFAFQLNRAHKDGQTIVDPAVLALGGLTHNFVSGDYAKAQLGTSVRTLFNKTEYLNGGAALMIELYDSTGKYNNKADLILQPRGLRMHLQTADNNLDPFKADKLFVQAYDAIECFSTIDHEYDPMAPVYMTDKAAVIHRYSWNAQYGYARKVNTLAVKKNTATSGDAKVIIVPGALMGTLPGYMHVITNAKKSLVGNDVAISNAGVITTNGDQAGDEIRIIFNDSATPIVGMTDDASEYVKATSAFTEVSIAANIVTGITVERGVDNKLFFANGGPYTYKYSDLRNNYAVTVFHPLLKGFEDYIEDGIAGKLKALIGIDEIGIHTIHSTMFFSLWSFMLCAATPFITKARINSFRDVLYYEKNVEYPFSNTLVPLKEVLTKAYSNFKYSDYDTELETGVMGVPSKIRWVMPELLQTVGLKTIDGTDYESVLLPWYVSENEIYVDITNDEVIFDDDAAAMAMPSIRSGVRYGPLDDMYALTEKDIRLSCDMIADWRYLAASGCVAAMTGAMKYSRMCDGQVYLGVEKGEATIHNFLSLPRQLGYVIDAPYGVLTPKYDDTYADLETETPVGCSGYRAYYWLGADAVGCEPGEEAILQSTGINVNRAANFTQKWYAILGSGTVPPVDHGFLLSMNQLFSSTGNLLKGRSFFHPYLQADDAVAPQTSGMAQLISLQKALWTRVQKLQMVISPFDLVKDISGKSYIFDIFDFAYIFGLAGFRASDFRESVYNREKEFVNQGVLFVNDPWIAASPLFKEGAAVSGVTKTEGFELK